MDYEVDVTIDPDALDVEWLRQPGLMLTYSKEAAKTRREADEAKERIDLVRAELGQRIRAHPDKYGIEKVTESQIESAITVHDNYQDAVKDYITAKYEAEMTRSAVAAIEQKKSALENLVRLHGQQYFAGPSVPRDLSKEWEEKERDSEVNRKMKMGRRT